MNDPFLQTLVSTLVGVIVGSAITVWLTYKFQKKLLLMQLEAQEKTHQELLNTVKTASELSQLHITSAIGIASQRSRIS